MKSFASTAKLLRILPLILAASSVAACSVSTPTAKAPIELPVLPKELQVCAVADKNCEPPCPFPVWLPDRDLDQAEVETYWRRDRASLRICRSSYEATAAFYENLRIYLRSPE